MNKENLISIPKYAAQNKCSTYSVIKQINLGKLKTIEIEGKTYIIANSHSIDKNSNESKIRRAEFSVNDKLAIKKILDTCKYGTLCLSEGEYPYGVPLNFVWVEDAIIFHGAKEGKKCEIIQNNPNALFNVVKPYSFIPSYFSDTKSACPATQFFASITIRGVVETINDLSQKAKYLNALMEKMQPEKGYDFIEVKNNIYTKALEKTALFKLDAANVSVKIKAGQNLSDKQKKDLILQLKERGSALDLATIKLIEKFAK